MWTMLGSWTMSVTQLVEASSVSQKCTLPKIFSYKNNFYFPRKKNLKIENEKKKHPVDIKKKNSIFFNSLIFFKKIFLHWYPFL